MVILRFSRISFFTGHSLTRYGCAAVALAIVLACAGCATSGGTASMMVQVSDGSKIAVPLGKLGVPKTKHEGVEMLAAASAPDAEKRLVYHFALRDAKGRSLQRVLIEDISDEQAVTLVDDQAPVWTNGAWKGSSRAFTWGEPELRWMGTLPHSMRVYRVTVTFSNGETVVLHQGALYPKMVKAAARESWGERY